MQNILLNDGKLIPIIALNDAIEVIEENLGYELAAYLRKEICDADALGEENDRLFDEHMRMKKEIDRLEDEKYELRKEICQLKDELEEEKDRTLRATHRILNEDEDIEDDCLPFN